MQVSNRLTVRARLRLDEPLPVEPDRRTAWVNAAMGWMSGFLEAAEAERDGLLALSALVGSDDDETDRLAERERRRIIPELDSRPSRILFPATLSGCGSSFPMGAVRNGRGP